MGRFSDDLSLTGASPAGALIADSSGDLFGVTSTGGTNGDGAIFELKNIGPMAAAI